MNTPIWPGVASLVSAQNLWYEIDYKKNRNEKPNRALIYIHSALFFTNAVICKCTMDKWRDH